MRPTRRCAASGFEKSDASHRSVTCHRVRCDAATLTRRQRWRGWRGHRQPPVPANYRHVGAIKGDPALVCKMRQDGTDSSWRAYDCDGNELTVTMAGYR